MKKILITAGIFVILHIIISSHTKSKYAWSAEGAALLTAYYNNHNVVYGRWPTIEEIREYRGVRFLGAIYNSETHYFELTEIGKYMSIRIKPDDGQLVVNFIDDKQNIPIQLQ
ncbi:MAG: hypothetical protein LBL13_01275 [Bacteroidales bacterium]|jgi:hypothetical protein|nr:hypothetical protein [Bacteroidales bacterium]